MTDTEQTPKKWPRITSIPRAVWVVVLVLLLFASPILVRRWSLSQVPDIGDPFDVAEFCKVDVPADQNAIPVYEAALAMYAAMDSAASEDSEKRGRNPGINFENRKDTAEEQELISAWRAAHRDALLEWKRGTTFKLARHLPPTEVEGSIWSQNHVVVVRMALLARLEAEEWEQRGDMATAWEWHRASFRFSRHLGHKGTLLDRLFGKGVHATAVDDLVRWAEHPSVTADQLRAALDEVRAVFSTSAPWSDVLRAEYVWLNEQLSKMTLHQLADENRGVFSGEPIWSRQFRLWVVGEPQLLLRLQRQVLANCLEEMDKPLTQRRTPASMSPLLFQPDPESVPQPGRLNPAEIKFAIQRSIGSGTFWASDTISKHVSSHEEDGREAVLELVLALQRYRRDRGEFPVELSLLVPQYLDLIPVDPCDPNGLPIRYRREESVRAVVWSVGPDHSDQGGVDITRSGQPKSTDVGFVVK